jgi:hypothetical protein
MFQCGRLRLGMGISVFICLLLILQIVQYITATCISLHHLVVNHETSSERHAKDT